MKLNILSDLHLGLGPLEPPRNGADVVILAGDIARPQQAVSWASGFDTPVIYVPGNHEFYGDSVASGTDALRRLCGASGIHLLCNDEVVIAGVRFLGTTLWTDFMLFSDAEQRAEAIQQALVFMRDFSRIRADAAGPALFTPADSAALFMLQSAWLAHRLAQAHAGPTVVITHHAPSRQSIHPRFADSPLNACFVSDAEHLIDASRAQLWVHGHTHDSFDYVLNGTRVVCNPRGYAKNGTNENPLFDPNFIVEIG